MKRFLDYNKKLKQRAAEMRKNMARAERKLWFDFLRDFSISKGDKDGVTIKVYRQRIIDHFIVDFYIPDCKLIIELDGETHYTKQGKVYDIERSNVLKGIGCQVLRFTNIQVYDNFESVCEAIINTYTKHNPPT